jgi:hypothetical protein
MHRLIKKFHTYAGLLSFTLMLIYGVAGLTATIRKGAEGSARGFGPPRFESFSVPTGLDTQLDKHQVSDLVYDHLKPPLVERLTTEMVETGGAGNPRLDFWSINGVQRVTVLVREGRLKIEKQRSDLPDFLNALHATLTGYPTSFPLIRVWGTYNHFGLLCMLFLALSGAYLWLVPRLRLPSSKFVMIAGAGLFVLICEALR